MVSACHFVDVTKKEVDDMWAYILLPFLISLLLGMPIAFVLGVTSLFIIIKLGDPNLLNIIPTHFYAGIDMFPLMAMPLFILAGEIMNRVTITERLTNLAFLLVGHLRGGVAHTNILASVIFAGLTGSAVADASALGTMLIPSMVKEGYHRGFAGAVTASASIIGPIIPPSIVMVIYGSIMGLSIAALFAAGVIPGLLLAVALMITAYRGARKRNYPMAAKRAPVKEILISAKRGVTALVLPLIILIGILGGFFTPTEAAAVAVFYGIFVGLVIYRNFKLWDLWDVLSTTSTASAITFIILSTAFIFSWLLTSEEIPVKIAAFVLSLTKNKYLILAMMNIFCLSLGCFMDTTPAVIILSPILLPLALKVGVHPLHFGVMMCLNLTIGLATPPVGASLFAACAVGHIKLEEISKEAIPFCVALNAVLVLVTYVPAVSMTLPRLLGFVQ